ncbi:MAG: hypothetical protein QOE63_937, partial [Acidimicrobiaceae bacterium]
FAVSALLVSGLRSGTTAHQPEHGLLGRLANATRFLWNERVVRRAVLVAATAQMSAAVVEALVVVDVETHLHAPSAAIGVLSAALPIGFLLTISLIRTDRGDRESLRLSALVILVGSAISVVGFAVQLSWPVAILPYAGVGIRVTSLVPANTVGTPRIPTAIRGSAIGVLQSTIIGSQALGAILGGVVASAYGTPTALTAAMVPCLLVSAFALLQPVPVTDAAFAH